MYYRSKITKKFHTLSFLMLFLGITITSPSFIYAAFIGSMDRAILTITPQTATLKAGDPLQANIYLNTRREDVVAVAAYLNYDPSHFEVVSIDTTNSIFNLEAEKIIDKNQGLIKITLGKPYPGVNTENGLVAVINLKALAPVNPSQDNFKFIFFPAATNESNVIKNDSLGTDILTGVYNARYITVYPDNTATATSTTTTTTTTTATTTTSTTTTPGGGSSSSGGLISRTGGGNTELLQRQPFTPIMSTTTLPLFLQGTATSTAASSTQPIKSLFTKNLYLGVTDPEVKMLQEFLAKDKTIYPEGIVSGHYDKATENAVKRFQCKHKIVCSGTAVRTGYGVVGPKTKDKLNEMVLEDVKIQREVMIEAIQEQIRTLQLLLVQLLNLLIQTLKGQGGGS